MLLFIRHSISRLFDTETFRPKNNFLFPDAILPNRYLKRIFSGALHINNKPPVMYLFVVDSLISGSYTVQKIF